MTGEVHLPTLASNDASPIILPVSAFDPIVIQLGVLAGLLIRDGEKSLIVNTQWFENPMAAPSQSDPDLRSIRTMATNPAQIAEMVGLIDTLFGQASSEAVGMPQITDGRQWHSINNPSTGEQTGFYVVTEQREDFVVFGLGAMNTFVVLDVDINPYIYFPLLVMPSQDGQTFVLGSEAFPIEIGVDVLSGDEPFGTGEVTFDGLKATATVRFSSQPFDLDIVLLNLKLPGKPAADTSINDLLKTPANEWVGTAIYLLISQIIKAAPQDKQTLFSNMADALLGMLGLVGDVPPVDWVSLVKNPSQAGPLLSNWMRAVLGNPTILKSWLEDWYALFHGVAPGDNVNGIGSRNDPFSIPLLTLGDNQLSLQMTLAVETDKTSGDMFVFPGLAIAAEPTVPLSSFPDTTVAARAHTELLRLNLPSSGEPPMPELFPSFQAVMTLNNPTAAIQTNDPDTDALISAGSFQAGFSYRKANPIEVATTQRGIYPILYLNDIVTPYGSWDRIDLLNFDELIENAGEVLAALVQQQLDAFFDMTGNTSAAKMSQALAALLGVHVPPGYTAETWPVKQLLLNGPGGIQTLINNPLGAWGGYISRCLATVDETSGQTAWQLLMPSVAVTLGDVDATSKTTSGTGTAESPWQIQLYTSDASTPAAYLQSWLAEAYQPETQPTLHTAIAFIVPLPISAINMTFMLQGDLLQLTLPTTAATGSMESFWFPMANGAFHVLGPPNGEGTGTQPLATPTIGGVKISTEKIAVSGGWQRGGDFFALVTLNQVKLFSQNTLVNDLGDIQFSFTPTHWDISDLSKFTQLVFSAAGSWAMAYGGRFGVSLSTGLGLLPDVSNVFNDQPPQGSPFALPEGLTLPDAWPALQVTDGEDGSFFIDPWDAIRAQLAAIFEDAVNAVPMMRLLGWSISNALPAAPDPTPTGTYSDPWYVVLTEFWNLQPLVWMAGEADNQSLGFGVARTMLDAAAAGVRLQVSVRIDGAEVSVADGTQRNDAEGSLPRVRLIADFVNEDASKPLIDDAQTGLRMGRAKLGVYVDADGLHPVVKIYQARLQASDALADYDLEDVLSPAKQHQILNSLMNALMTKLTTAVADLPGMADLMDLLTDLALVTFQDDAYRVDFNAWANMLSNPTQFLVDQMQLILEDPVALQSFYDHLAGLLGFDTLEPPAALQGLPPLLTALGLMAKYDGGYALVLDAWLSLIQDPVGYLQAAGRRFFDPDDDSLRTTLVSALSALPRPSGPLADVPLYIENGSRIVLQIPLDKLISVGDQLSVSAQLVLNIQDLHLIAQAKIFSSYTDVALNFKATLAMATARRDSAAMATIPMEWGLALEGAGLNDVPAPFEPLVFYPLPDEASQAEYLKELGTQVPILLVSTFATGVLNQYVMDEGRYPVIYRILKDFGLTTAKANGDGEQVQGLVGVFQHPLDWFLSPAVLGDGEGGFSLDRIGALMAAIPGPDGVVGPAGIKLVQNGENGMKVEGLPFAGTVTFSSSIAAGIQISGAMSETFDSVPAAGNLTPSVAIQANMGFGQGSGVAVGGSIVPQFVFQTDPLTDLALTVSFSTETGFLLGLRGTLNDSVFPPAGTDPDVIVLVPFRGLSQFQAGAMALMQFAGTQLQTLWETYKNGTPNQSVVQIVESLISVMSFFGVNDPASLLATIQDLVDDPMAWLQTYFSAEKLPDALAEINTLLTDTFGVPGFTIDDNDLLVYTPELPVEWGQLQIKFGEQDNLFGVWVYPKIVQEWVVFDATAGIGFQTPLSNDNLSPQFRLHAGLGANEASIPPQIPGAPMLLFGFDVGADGLDGFLRAYPLGVGTTADDLLVELLPTPHFAYGDAPENPVAASEWLLAFSVDYLVPLVADILLQTEAVAVWLDSPILSGQDTSPKPGVMLSDWGLLEVASDGPPVLYALVPPRDMFADMSPLEIMEKLFLVVLKALDGFKLIPIGQNGGIYVSTSTRDEITSYGILLQIQDLQMTGEDATTQLSIQLGKWLSDKSTGDDNWIVKSDPALKGSVNTPGLAFYLVSEQDDKPIFSPGVTLASIGVDFFGPDGKPLINVNGFQVGRIEPRIYLDVPFTNIQNTAVGGAIKLGQMGIPLGPDNIAKSAGNDNPVAANILTSGEGETTEETEAVNPTFSAIAGYVYDPSNSTDLVIRLFRDDDPDGGGNFIWLPIQRSFGPVACRQIGFGWDSDDKKLLAGFDGAVSLFGLAIDLIKLKVGIPVTDPTNFNEYSLDLEGINVTFEGGPVLVSGGFLKTTTEYEGRDIVVYSGQARITAKKFGLSAVGSYAMIGQNTPSLFVFALLSVPLGGPPYFFVTGLAAGFGYNRDLLMPNVNNVASFPLVAGVLDPNYFNGNDAEAALAKLADDVPPKRGQYWLAAGLQFTTFKMLDSFALLSVSFGTEFEINLIGLSVLELPVSVDAGPAYSPIARAELQILVSFRPAVGLLSIEAALSNNSYLLDKDAHLTGGFAFYVWFAPSEHAGDFVVTFGGYHPRFKPNAWYPDVPRIGFNWRVSNTVSMDGGLYFALVPTAVMAGGNLSLQYRSGNLRAWLDAGANFLISWKPFYYDIDIHVSVGASYRVKVWFVDKTFKVELGASLNIWGPPTGGKARVSWWVISFTIGFGPGKTNKPILDWAEFDESFLPQNKSTVSVPAAQPIAARAMQRVANQVQRDARATVSIGNGLIQTIMNEETGEVLRWIIDPQSFEIITNTQVPATTASVNGKDVQLAGTTPTLGIVPMAKQQLNAKQVVTVTRLNEETLEYEAADPDLFTVTPIVQSVPRAMWNNSAPDPFAKDQLIKNVMVGLRLTARVIAYNSTLPVPEDQLQFAAPGRHNFAWGDITPPVTPQYPQYPPNPTIETEMTTIMDVDVATRRAALLEDLYDNGYFVRQTIDASLLATSADKIYLAQPILAPLGGVIDWQDQEGADT